MHYFECLSSQAIDRSTYSEGEQEREHPFWRGGGGVRVGARGHEWESICVVSAAICVSEHITETVRPVPTPPLSPCCLLGTNIHTYMSPNHPCHCFSQIGTFLVPFCQHLDTCTHTVAQHCFRSALGVWTEVNPAHAFSSTEAACSKNLYLCMRQEKETHLLLRSTLQTTPLRKLSEMKTKTTALWHLIWTRLYATLFPMLIFSACDSCFYLCSRGC